MFQHIRIVFARLKKICLIKLFVHSDVRQVSYLVEAGVVEHILAPALYDGRVAGDVAIGSQHLQAVTAKRNVTPGNN